MPCQLDKYCMTSNFNVCFLLVGVTTFRRCYGVFAEWHLPSWQQVLLLLLQMGPQRATPHPIYVLKPMETASRLNETRFKRSMLPQMATIGATTMTGFPIPATVSRILVVFFPSQSSEHRISLYDSVSWICE